MSKNLKIAIYTGIVPTTTFIDRLIKGLAHSGHTIFLFGLQRGNTKAIKNIHYITYTNRLSKAILLFKYSFLLGLFFAKDKKKLDAIIASKNKNKRQLKSKYYPVLYHRPEIFHLQWAKGVSDWQWVQEFGIKYIVSLRGGQINYSPIADKQVADDYVRFFPKVDGFHAVSNAIAMESLKYKSNDSKIRIIYTGLDLDEFTFFEKESVLSAPIKILSVGRVHWKKGYSYAIDAIDILKSKNVSVQYTIIGVENDEELLYKRNYFNLNDRISFKKNLPFESVRAEIKKADVLLLPSVEEGIANVVVEAMALGTLVVSANCGGMGELVTNNVNGFLIPLRNSNAIANAIKRLSTMTIEEYNSLIRKARSKVEKNHSETKMITEMNEFYELVKLDAL